MQCAPGWPKVIGTRTSEEASGNGSGSGTARTDSIAVVERDLFWGMSQDPNNLWTYRAKKISNERVSIDD